MTLKLIFPDNGRQYRQPLLGCGLTMLMGDKVMTELAFQLKMAKEQGQDFNRDALIIN